MTMFILGFLLMSFFAFLALAAFDNDKTTRGVILSGPFSWVVFLVIFINNKLRRYLKFRNVRSLLVCPDGDIRYINDKKADTMRECADKKYDFPDFNTHPEWNVKDWNKWFAFFGCGNMRYTPKKIWTQYEQISNQEYKYAKEHPADKEN